MRYSRVPFMLLVLALTAAPAFAQGVGINATGAAADTSALLDVSSVTKGLLAPRMTAAQRAAIVLPANGLLIYQTDGTTGLYVNAGTPAAPGWQPVGSAGASQWTSNGTAIYYNTGRVGIGRSAPASPLDILGGNWDVVGGEGDFRIGDASTRLKIGIATAGGGTGAATIMEQGAAGAYNVLALGTQGNKVLYVNGNSQRVGIGVDQPTALLGFGTTFGKKISLYPGALGDAGFGIASNRLQVFGDNPNADVALGYDSLGTFNERFTVKPSGALAVRGNTGTAGQVLQSNGSATTASWVSPTSVTYNNLAQIVSLNSAVIPDGGTASLPDMIYPLSLAAITKVLVSFAVVVSDPTCTLCSGSTAYVNLAIDGIGNTVHVWRADLNNGGRVTISGTWLATIGAGAHTVTLWGSSAGKTVTFGLPSTSFGNVMTVQVIPQ